MQSTAYDVFLVYRKTKWDGMGSNFLEYGRLEWIIYSIESRCLPFLRIWLLLLSLNTLGKFV